MFEGLTLSHYTNVTFNRVSFTTYCNLPKTYMLWYY
uniref:Uncharacterized protein n=1 Tax=Arundo donax TaxID=35708 RepID=A0A0A9BFE1_ARUDO